MDRIRLLRKNKVLRQKINYLVKRLFQSDLFGNLSLTPKVIKILLLLSITNHLFISCGAQNDVPRANNNMTGGIPTSQYEQEIQRDIHQLRNTNRIISANSDIRDMTWLLSWGADGEIYIETSTSSEDKVYNFANAINRNGAFIVASQSDLNNPEDLSEDETFRVLEFEHSSREVKGRILRANKQTIILMKDAITSQTVFTENTAPIEAFFKLTFARAAHSYSIHPNSQNAAVIDQLLQNRQAYVFISTVYWTDINMGTSLKGLNITLDHNNNNGNNFGLSRNTPYPRSNTPTSNFRLDGKVDVSIDLLSLTGGDDYSITNIFFQQSAREFLNPYQTERIRAVLTTDSDTSDDQESSNLGSIYLRKKTLNPLHFVFDISISLLSTSTNATSNISNLVFIDPFEDVGIQRDLLSEIGVRKDRGILGKLNPINWLKGLGRIFGR